MLTNRDSLLDEVRELTAKLTRANRAASDAFAERQAIIRQGHREGIPLAELAKASGASLHGVKVIAGLVQQKEER